jgi:hypothetical protein
MGVQRFAFDKKIVDGQNPFAGRQQTGVVDEKRLIAAAADGTGPN